MRTISAFVAVLVVVAIGQRAQAASITVGYTSIRGALARRSPNPPPCSCSAPASAHSVSAATASASRQGCTDGCQQ